MLEKHANHASLWTATTYMTNMRVRDPLSMVPKPKSFGSASKIHLQKNPSKMKPTVEGEFSFDEKADEQVVHYHWPTWATYAIRSQNSTETMANAKVPIARSQRGHDTFTVSADKESNMRKWSRDHIILT